MKIKYIIKTLPPRYNHFKKGFTQLLNNGIVGITECEFWGILTTIAFCSKNEEFVKCIKSDANEYMEYPYDICKLAAIYSSFIYCTTGISLREPYDQEESDDLKVQRYSPDEEEKILLKKLDAIRQEVDLDCDGDRWDLDIYFFAALLFKGNSKQANYIAASLLQQGLTYKSLEQIHRLIGYFKCILEASEIEAMNYNDFFDSYDYR